MSSSDSVPAGVEDQRLQVARAGPREAPAAGVGSDPHPLDLGRGRRRGTAPPPHASGRLVRPGEDEPAPRGGVRRRGVVERRTDLEPELRRDLGEVLPHRPPRRRRCRVDHAELHHRLSIVASTMTVDTRRAPYAGWRALAATVLVMAGAVGAHTWAGGHLPDGSGRDRARRRRARRQPAGAARDGVRGRLLLPAVAAAQAGLHTSFAVSASATTRATWTTPRRRPRGAGRCCWPTRPSPLLTAAGVARLCPGRRGRRDRAPGRTGRASAATAPARRAAPGAPRPHPPGPPGRRAPSRPPGGGRRA